VDRELPRLLAQARAGGAEMDGTAAARGAEVVDGAEVVAGAQPVDEGPAVYGLVRLFALQPDRTPGAVVDPWSVPSGWQLGGPRPLLLRIEPSGPAAGPLEVRVWGPPEAARVQVGAGPAVPAAIRVNGANGDLLVTLNGRTRKWRHAVEADRIWLWCAGRTWVIGPAVIRLREQSRSGGAAEVRSPMPGVVLAVLVDAGDLVQGEQPLVIVEAMKMEHTVRAARPGRVGELRVRVGDQVALDQSLTFILSAEEPGEIGGPE